MTLWHERRTDMDLPGDTATQRQVRIYTNDQIAHRLSVLALTPRAYTRDLRNALLEEAARRLRWDDVYNAHKGA